MEMDDGATDATVITCFAGMDYPTTQVFIDKDVDGVFCIDKRAAVQLTTDPVCGTKPYAFIETVPVTCYAVDKAGLTATNLLEQMEQEIRHVCTGHPLGSIRGIESTKPASLEIGGVKLWFVEVVIRYKRANDDYSATYPTLTWGESGNPDGTYTFPNCTQVRYLHNTPDIKLLPPGRVGNVHQIMGDTSLVVELTCDLDVDAPNKNWLRAQGGAATDEVKWQVLLEIKHNAGILDGDEPYQTLTLGASGPSFDVRLQDLNVYNTGDGQRLVVSFEEYCSSGKGGSTAAQRYGIT
jgi:hypothetical protein